MRQLPSGRWQARWRAEDGRLVSAPETFDTKLDAGSWLRAHAAGDLVEPERLRLTLDQYTENFLTTRELKPRTRLEYPRLYDGKIKDTFGNVDLARISPAMVRQWYGTLDPEHRTRRAHAYSLLRTILNAAIADDLIHHQPVPNQGRWGEQGGP